MIRRHLGLVGALLVAAGLAAAGRAADADAPWGPPVPIEIGIVYGRAGGVDLKLDLARPTVGRGPFPGVIDIHGGGWQSGDRRSGHGPMQLLANHGYLAVSISYRFAPAHRWPAQLEDAKAAVRYLRAHAGEYDIDPARIGVMGESSGGHLALMLGLTRPADGFEGAGGSPGVSSAVQAVVSYCAVTDFPHLPDVTPRTPAEAADLAAKRQLLVDLTGTADRADPVWRALSPGTYVGPHTPPILLFQGAADPVVPPGQVEYLDAALTRLGRPHETVVYPGVGHVWRDAARAETNRRLLAFFDRCLKADAAP